MIEYNDDIKVSIETQYLSEQSIENEQYVFSYTITIENATIDHIQLLERSWLITDANGDVTSVEGEGVVGNQPHLAPQKTYTYSSGCAFKTPVGTMQGFYLFTTSDGQKVKANIPVFTLAKPNIFH